MQILSWRGTVSFRGVCVDKLFTNPQKCAPPLTCTLKHCSAELGRGTETPCTAASLGLSANIHNDLQLTSFAIGVTICGLLDYSRSRSISAHAGVEWWGEHEPTSRIRHMLVVNYENLCRYVQLGFAGQEKPFVLFRVREQNCRTHSLFTEFQY